MEKNSFHRSIHNSGFSLIETLISGFILALGLLGLAGMQSMAVKSTIEVQQRNLANSLLIDITERMQLNQLWLQEAGNNYAIESLADAALLVPSCINADSTFEACTGEDIRDNDLYEWRQKFNGEHINASLNGENGLVEADACIAATPIATSNGELVKVVISWFSTIESKDAADGAVATDLTATCGTASHSRRQISIETYISKSS